MASTIILAKLDSLHRCLARVESKTPASLNVLESDLDIQDIITLNLTRAVQICVDIATHIIADFNTPPPTSMAESFDRLKQLQIISEETSVRLKKAVGFRNVSIHEYQNIDWLIVYKIITEHLQDFKEFARQVYAWPGRTQGSALDT